MRSLVKNFTLTLSANVLGILVSALTTFLLPKIMGVTEYSYYQLYTFYVGYLGYAQLGLAEGIYLRLGGFSYNKIDKQELKAEIKLYELIVIIVFALLMAYSYIDLHEPPKSLVWKLISISALFVLPSVLLLYILQATYRIKEYVNILVIRSSIVLLGTILLFSQKNEDFALYCLVVVLSQLVSVVYGVCCCWDIFVATPSQKINVTNTILKDFSSGIKLALAMVSGSLIVGIVRFAIEKKWGIETFGKISLTLSISNFLMVGIRAVALVIFPLLRRMSSKTVVQVYGMMRTVIMVPLLGLLVLYQPIKLLISIWLPQYADTLVYMALLFPVCIFESKMSMLIEPYMKTFYKERWLLAVNIMTLGMCVCVTAITVFVVDNLTLAVLSIVFLLAFRCIFAERLLAQMLQVKVDLDIVLELLLTLTFILSSWFVGGWFGSIIYISLYIVYVIIKKRNIGNVFDYLKNSLAKSSN